jgi:hypothetical protein
VLLDSSLHAPDLPPPGLPCGCSQDSPDAERMGPVVQCLNDAALHEAAA